MGTLGLRRGRGRAGEGMGVPPVLISEENQGTHDKAKSGPLCPADALELHFGALF